MSAKALDLQNSPLKLQTLWQKVPHFPPGLKILYNNCVILFDEPGVVKPVNNVILHDESLVHLEVRDRDVDRGHGVGSGETHS